MHSSVSSLILFFKSSISPWYISTSFLYLLKAASVLPSICVLRRADAATQKIGRRDQGKGVGTRACELATSGLMSPLATGNGQVLHQASFIISVSSAQMPSFLEKILLATRFTTTCSKTEFLPRKVGLGYELAAVKVERSVLRPVFRAIRKREKLQKESRLRENKSPEMEDSSSEEVSKMAHITKKARK